MRRAFEQGILKHLAAVAITVGAGAADPAPSLARVPEEVLADVVEGVEEDGWATEDRSRMLLLLARDQRPAVRARVAEHADVLVAQEPDRAVDLLRSFVHDRAPEVRDAAVLGLERVVGALSPVDRIPLVADWVTSPDAAERAAVAAALRCSAAVYIRDVAVEQLAEDPEPEVRALAVEVAERHFRDDPETYGAVLARLADDPVRGVRRRARRSLRRVGAG